MKDLNKVKKMISIFSIVIVLSLVGTSIYLLRRNSIGETDSGYNIAFGILPSPINRYSEIRIAYVLEKEYTEDNEVYPVYLVDTTSTFYPSKLLTSKVADNLGLDKNETFGDVYLLTNEKRTMDLIYKRSSHSIQLLIYKPVYSNQKLNTLASTSSAIEYLREIDLWPFEEDDYLVSYQYYISFGSELSEVDESEKANADRISISFSQNINGTNISCGRYNSGEITVTMNGDNEILEVLYNYTPIDQTIKATYPLISFSDVVYEINNKRFELVQKQYIPPSSTINISNIDIKYFNINSDQEHLQPVYFLEGTDKDANIFTLLVPAISNDYLLAL